MTSRRRRWRRSARRPSSRRIDGLAPGRGAGLLVAGEPESVQAQPGVVGCRSSRRTHPGADPRGAQARRGSGAYGFMGGPFNGPDDLGFLERCITRSIPGSMIPVMYGNNYQIVQTPGFVVITYEIIHEARVIPLDARPHVGANLRMHMGDARGHWRRHPGRRDDQLHEGRGVSRRRSRDLPRRRALHACRRRHDSMDRDDGGSGNVDEAVDDRDAAGARQAVARSCVRVSRAQLRAREHSQAARAAEK